MFAVSCLPVRVRKTHLRYRYRTTWDERLGMTAVTNTPYTCQSLQFTAQKLPKIKQRSTKSEGKLGKVFTFLASQLVKNAIYQGRIHLFLPSIECFPHEQVPVHINRFEVHPTSSIHCQFDTVSNIERAKDKKSSRVAGCVRHKKAQWAAKPYNSTVVRHIFITVLHRIRVDSGGLHLPQDKGQWRR